MVHLRIIIGDRDHDFIQKLSNYLSSESDHCFTSYCFSDPSYLSQFLDNNPTDILLISEEFYQTIQPKDVFVVLFIDSLRSNELQHIPAILKYQKVVEMITQLKDSFSEHANKQISIHKGSHAELIGVYSPCGGSGKTVISLSLARQLASRGKKTLFISLEEISSVNGLMQGEQSSHLSDLLFYSRKHPDKLALKLDTLKGVEKKTGLDYLLPSALPEDTWSRENELVLFITLLKEMRSYSYIVIDFTSGFSKENVRLMCLCNQLLLLTNMTTWHQLQLKICVERLKALPGMNAKLKLICNLTQAQVDVDSFELEKIQARIPYVEQLIRRDGGKLIVVDSEAFVLAIKNLGEKVLQDE